MDDGAGDAEVGELLERFVEDVAGVQVGSDEDVGVALDGGGGEFLAADVGVDGAVELHLAVNEPVGVVVADFVDDEVDFVEIGVLAAGAVGGVGEHGDAGLLLIV